MKLNLTKDWYERRIENEDNQMDNFWKNLDTQLMVTAAHRYCLHRQSYIVGAAIDWLRTYREGFERNTVRVIVRDTVEALQDNAAGSPTIDAPAWRQLAKEFYDAIPAEDQEWVRNDTAGRKKEWPL